LPAPFAAALYNTYPYELEAGKLQLSLKEAGKLGRVRQLG